MELSEAQKGLSEIYKKVGWTLDWNYPIKDERRNCFWHGDGYAVAKGSYREHEWEITYGSYGDVIGTLFDENGEELAEVRDKNNDGDRGDIENYIDNDEELKKAKQDGRLVLENNNWDEMLVSMDGGEQWTNQNNIGDTDDVISDVWLPADLFEYLNDFLEEA